MLLVSRAITRVSSCPYTALVAMFEFTICSAIQGHHVYKAIWENPIIREELKCQREVGNSHDTLAVAVLKRLDGHDTIIGHVSRRISGSCNAFIRRGGIIQCTVIGSRRYNVDLIQGGLEVPCKLRFVIPSKEFCKKTEILVCATLSTTTTFSLDKSTSMVEEESKAVEIKMDESCKSHSGSESRPLSPPVLCSDVLCDEESQTNTTLTQSVVDNSIMVEEVVCSPPKKRQKKFNEEAIIMGEKLTDIEIDLAQRILKSQFPNINGLRSTLLQCKPCTAADQINENKLQIVFCKDRSHWILATTIGCEAGEVKVYDSIFSSLDKESLRTIMNLFSSENNKPRVRLSPSQRQKGSNDCGIFSIAVAVAVTFGLNPSKLHFQQERMRVHLVNCFTRELFSLFPVV